MSPSPSAVNWVRLGEQLTRRRVELNPRYANRTAFASERGIDYRLAYDIEEARRVNFRRTTLQAVAAAYAVTFDSLTALRDGSVKSLEALPGTPSVDEPPPRPDVPFPGAPAREPSEMARSLFPGDLVKQWLYDVPTRGPEQDREKAAAFRAIDEVRARLSGGRDRDADGETA